MIMCDVDAVNAPILILVDVQGKPFGCTHTREVEPRLPLAPSVLVSME